MKVLFICRGNVARSQEAALFCEKLSAGTIMAESAGIRPIIGKPIDPDVVTVMNELGYDMSSCYRKALAKNMIAAADVVVSFVPRCELPEYAAVHPVVQSWYVPDPRHKGTAYHRRVRGQIQHKVEELVTSLLDQPLSSASSS